MKAEVYLKILLFIPDEETEQKLLLIFRDIQHALPGSYIILRNYTVNKIVYVKMYIENGDADLFSEKEFLKYLENKLNLLFCRHEYIDLYYIYTYHDAPIDIINKFKQIEENTKFKNIINLEYETSSEIVMLDEPGIGEIITKYGLLLFNNREKEKTIVSIETSNENLDINQISKEIRKVLNEIHEETGVKFNILQIGETKLL